MIGGGYVVGETTFYLITAPVLIYSWLSHGQEPGAYELTPMGRGFAVLPESYFICFSVFG